jgi:hypothetical protein
MRSAVTPEQKKKPIWKSLVPRSDQEPSETYPMKTMSRLAVGAIFIAAVDMRIAAAPKDPSALAMLRGVELARSKYDNLRVEFVLKYSDGTQQCEIPCLVEQAGGRRRFEQFPGGCLKEGSVFVIGLSELWGYRRKEHEDLEIYDMARAVGVCGDTAFDPRLLGLGGVVIPVDATFRTYLWIETCDGVQRFGPEEYKGIPVWRVHETRGEEAMDWWIEEPSFRVHKCVAWMLGGPDLRVEIQSDYETDKTVLPYPKRVQVTRQEGMKWKRLEIAVNRFEVDNPVSDERFAMKSLDLPINTMINDYRINRIMGYWDGEKISPEPVPAEKLNALVSPKRNQTVRLVLMIVNGFLVAALAFVLWRRWRKRVRAVQ